MADVDVIEWAKRMAECVNQKDFATARTLVHDNVVAFGSHTHVVSGLDYLEARQWRMVWPMISNFAFIYDELYVEHSTDRLMAVVLLPGTAIGYTHDGREYVRSSRSTFVLTRAHVDEPFKAIHVHVSMAPGTPLRTFEPPRPEAEGV